DYALMIQSELPLDSRIGRFDTSGCIDGHHAIGCGLENCRKVAFAHTKCPHRPSTFSHHCTNYETSDCKGEHEDLEGAYGLCRLVLEFECDEQTCLDAEGRPSRTHQTMLHRDPDERQKQEIE